MDLWTLTDLATPWSVHVVATLRIAHHIESGLCSIADLARAVGADPDFLDRVMRHLVSKGLFVQTAKGEYALNDLARGLLEDGLLLGLDLDSFGGRMAGAWNTLLSAVRTGKPAYHEAFGRPFWEDLQANSTIADDFDALMGVQGHGLPDPRVLARPEDWEDIKSVVDVGGGTGALLAEILASHPHVHGTLVDLPQTVAKARNAFLKVSDRATLVGQSFFDPLPAGADLYVLKSVIGDWPDLEAQKILDRCAEAARSSKGRVVVFNGAGPGEEGSPGLLMLVLLGGKERSYDELCDLARRAGLEPQRFHRQKDGRGIVEFCPVDR